MMLKKRKLKLIHYLILSVLFVVAVGFNVRLYFINFAQCEAGTSGVCGDLLAYKISENLAYFSLLTFGVYLVYIYFIGINSNQDNSLNDEEMDFTEEPIIDASAQHKIIKKKIKVKSRSSLIRRTINSRRERIKK